MRNVTLALASGALLWALPINAPAHGGGLDAYGCHHNRKAGGYHCHRGALAGQSFSSKNEMLRALAKQDTSKPRPKK